MPKLTVHMRRSWLLSTTRPGPKLCFPVRSSEPATIGFQTCSISAISVWSNANSMPAIAW